MSTLPECKVTVEVLKAGRWAQEPWLPQLQVEKGDCLSISISFAHTLQRKGKCKIIVTESSVEVVEEKTKTAKQVKRKSEKNPALKDKKAAEG